MAAWLAEPDWLGWPQTDYPAFCTRLAVHRALLDARRGADDDVGREYRRRHPTCRPGLSPDQHDRLVWRFPVDPDGPPPPQRIPGNSTGRAHASVSGGDLLPDAPDQAEWWPKVLRIR